MGVETGDVTKYPQEGKEAIAANSSSSSVLSKTTTGLREVFDTDLYKSFPVLSLIGFVAIGFSGHLTLLVTIGYSAFLIFLIILHNILFLIKEKPFELWRKIQKFNSVVFEKLERLKILLCIVLFSTFYCLLKLYFLLTEEGLF